MNDEINLPENEMISAQTMKYLLDRESARHERTVKRLIISYTIILLLIIGSIIYFVLTSEIESTTIDQDGQGVNIVGDSYDDEPYSNKRDSMGRYSREERKEMASRLYEAMDRTPDYHSREAIRDVAKRLDRE